MGPINLGPTLIAANAGNMKAMSQYIDIHPENPQARLINKVVDRLRDGGLIAYPTDSGYALACMVAIVGNTAFRLIKRLTPGPYTFILKGTKEVPRMTLNPKKHTLGIRIPDYPIAQSLVEALGEPLLSSTFIRPGEEEPETSGWEIHDELGHLIDIVIEGPVASTEPTTVIDLTEDVPEVLRQGAGDTSTI